MPPNAGPFTRYVYPLLRYARNEPISLLAIGPAHRPCALPHSVSAHRRDPLARCGLHASTTMSSEARKWCATCRASSTGAIPAASGRAPGTLATIKQRKLREYLGILAQLRSEL